MSDTSSNRTAPIPEKPPMPESKQRLFANSWRDAELAASRALFFKILIGGCVSLVIAMFCIFSIYWGALWKVPDHQLHGWVLNFDSQASGSIGQAVMQGMLQTSATSTVRWAEKTGVAESDVAHQVLDQKTWAAVVSEWIIQSFSCTRCKLTDHSPLERNRQSRSSHFFLRPYICRDLLRRRGTQREWVPLPHTSGRTSLSPRSVSILRGPARSEHVLFHPHRPRVQLA